MPRSVVLLGKGELAIRICEWFQDSRDYHLRCVVPVIPEPSWTDSLSGWCGAHDVPVVASGHYRHLDATVGPDWFFDLALSVFYDKILPSRFVQRTGRCLNLHNSPLPRYRGISPINWALKNSETTHGVTIHEVTPCIDGGPIVSQLRYDVYPKYDEVIDVYNRALDYGFVLFRQAMPIIDRIEPRLQNEADATYYSYNDQRELGERRNFTRAESREMVSSLDA